MPLTLSPDSFLPAAAHNAASSHAHPSLALVDQLRDMRQSMDSLHAKVANLAKRASPAHTSLQTAPQRPHPSLNEGERKEAAVFPPIRLPPATTTKAPRATAKPIVLVPPFISNLVTGACLDHNPVYGNETLKMYACNNGAHCNFPMSMI